MTKAKTTKTKPVRKTSATKKPSAEAGTAAAAGSPSSLDEASGAASLARLRARLLTVDQPPRVHFNVRTAAAAGLGLVQLIAEHKLRPSYEALAKAGLFELGHLDGLADLAQALWYLRHRLDEQTALRSRATLPAALVSESSELRRHMLRVLTFRFEEEPSIAARLDYIRSGTGHHDLADDLMQLAGLYDQHKATLTGTPSPYDAKDQDRAAQKAVAILQLLGLAPNLDKTGAAIPTATANFNDLQRRCAFLLERSYEEVAAAGRFICRADDALVQRFAPLGSVARSRPGARKKDDSGDTEPAPAAATQ